MTQPAQLPSLNVNDRCSFVSLKSRVWGKRTGSIYDLVEGVKKINMYDSETLGGVAKSKRYNQVLGNLGEVLSG